MIGIPDPGNDWNKLLEKIPAPPGGSFFVVGGWVRDLLLLGRRGIRADIDIVTPDGLGLWARAVSEVFRSDIRTEPDFLTARTVVNSGGLPPVRIDMSQFRNEVYERPGALPTVSPGSMEEDLYRRDFTMNAIMLEWSVSRKRFIRIIDPFEGRSDLKCAIVRLVRPHSFTEDPTRIFRFARLSVRLGLHPAGSLEASLAGALTSPLWDTIGSSRIAREMERLLQEPDPLGVLAYLSETSVLESLLGMRTLSPSRLLRLRRWASYREPVSRSQGLSDQERQTCFQELFFLGFFFGMSRTQFSKMADRLGVADKLKFRIGQVLFQSASWPFRGFYEGLVLMGRGDPGEVTAVADKLSFSQVLMLSLLAPERDLPFWRGYIEEERWVPPLLGGEELLKFPTLPPSERGRILSEMRELQRTGKLLGRDQAAAWLSQRVSEGFP
jgi:tRNA nucleotidyltransferase (CCA-adding enzyme)